MNIFDMDKNSLPEQVQKNKDDIKYLMDNASEKSCALRAAIAPTFNIANNYNAGDLVWYNDGTDDSPEYYLYQANTNITAGVWDNTQWDLVKLQDLLTVLQAQISDIADKIDTPALWVNPDITVSFAAQNITIDDSSDYDYLIIAYLQYGGSNYSPTTVKIKNNVGEKISVEFIYATSSDLEQYSRQFTISSNTSISVGECYGWIGGSGSSKPYGLLPVAIYGAKLLL